MQYEKMTPLLFARSRMPEAEVDKFLDRINRVWRYAIEQGAELRPFSRHLEMTAAELQFLTAKYPADSDIPSESEGTAHVNRNAPKQGKPKIQAPKEVIDKLPDATPQLGPIIQKQYTPLTLLSSSRFGVTVLDLINYAEMVAATCGLVLMFSWVGLVFSLITNAFYFDAMRTVKKASSWGSAQFALFICLLLSTVYAFVHFNTAMKMIADDTQFDKVTVAIVAAIILSGISWSAMRQSYLKKNEEVENG